MLKVEIILGNHPREDHPKLSSLVFYNHKGPYGKKIGKSMLEEGNVRYQQRLEPCSQKARNAGNLLKLEETRKQSLSWREGGHHYGHFHFSLGRIILNFSPQEL